MLEHKRIIISSLIAVPLIIILLIILSAPKGTSKSPVYNIIENCSEEPKMCEEDQDHFILGQFGDQAVHVKVVGTIYRNVGNVTIYASCYDDLGHGLESNASLVIYDKDNATYLNWTNMSTFSGYNHKYIGAVPNETGNYFVVVNCTSGSDWGLGYSEFQVPDWLQTLLNTSNQSEENVETLINITNTTQDWVGKMMEYWGILTYTCLDIENDAPTTADRGGTWGIRSLVTDEYGTTQTGSDVACNISTSFWGEDIMTYSVITEKFTYYNYLNSSGILAYNVTCEEIGENAQNIC
ncbi:hypothetical protein LCGC14_0363300 [marine sediment metagenome]|uniref:Uncharacterized protein n=1 Tax=marine sediment metagenome TaxID=412755 RepID=A0A0F9TD53_9ZZZZ